MPRKNLRVSWSLFTNVTSWLTTFFKTAACMYCVLLHQPASSPDAVAYITYHLCPNINFSEFANHQNKISTHSSSNILVLLCVNVECILFDCQTALNPVWAPCDAPSVLHTCGSVKIHKYVSSLLSQPPPWMETALSVTYQVQLKSVKKYVVKRN